MKNQKLESYRVQIWKLEQTAESLQKDLELLKYQLAIMESDGKENSSGVEAAKQIDPSRIITRRGSNSKKLALAQAINKK